MICEDCRQDLPRVKGRRLLTTDTDGLNSTTRKLCDDCYALVPEWEGDLPRDDRGRWVAIPSDVPK